MTGNSFLTDYDHERLAVSEPDPHYTDTAPQAFRLERPSSLPLNFEGWLLGHVDSRDHMSEHSRKYRDRWADISIYRTTTGKWVVAQIGKTREPDGEERGVVRVCETPAEVLAALRHREGYLTKVNLEALEMAQDLDHDLDEASEEYI